MFPRTAWELDFQLEWWRFCSEINECSCVLVFLMSRNLMLLRSTLKFWFHQLWFSAGILLTNCFRLKGTHPDLSAAPSYIEFCVVGSDAIISRPQWWTNFRGFWFLFGHKGCDTSGIVTTCYELHHIEYHMLRATSYLIKYAPNNTVSKITCYRLIGISE